MSSLVDYVRCRLSRASESPGDYAGIVVPLSEVVPSRRRKVADAVGEDVEAGLPLRSYSAGGDEASGMLGDIEEYSIEGLRAEARRGRPKGEWNDYELKSKIINKAIQDIGMGRYNWQLFALCGFGWFADNLWLQGIALTLPSLASEFNISDKMVRLTTCALFLGLCVGSSFWGISSDILGRRLAFNVTLLIAAISGLLASYAPSWAWTCVAYAMVGVGVGGNLPVDGALFLEILPDSCSSLLTLLSVWWPIGQLVASVLAWILIPSAPAADGWRNFLFAIGTVTLLMFSIRFFVFRLFESPKFLLSKGRQAEAVAVVYGIANCNGVRTWLTEEILDAIVYDDDDDKDGSGDYNSNSVLFDSDPDAVVQSPRVKSHCRHPSPEKYYATGAGMSVSQVLRFRLQSFSGARLSPLFATAQLGRATALVWFVWAMIGLGYPLFNAFLPQYLAGSMKSPSSTPATLESSIESTVYASYVLASLVGIPGSLLAFATVDHSSPLLGRRGTLAVSTLLSGVFLFLFALLGKTPAARLGFSCAESFTQNIMYGVLYAFTPEIFPTPVRGAGTGVASFLNRAMGLLAPVIAATVPGDSTAVPIYLSGALILLATVGIIGIPIETRGRPRL